MAVMYRIKTEFTGLPGMPGLNQLYFAASGGAPGSAHAQAFQFWDAVSAVQNADLLFNVLAEVEHVESTNGQIVEVSQSTAASGRGTVNTEALPFATQGLIRARTGAFLGGREVRGKIFVPGLSENSSTLGQMANTTETVLQNAVDGLIGATTASWGIYSRVNGVIQPVTAASVWNQFAVLRSRRD